MKSILVRLINKISLESQPLYTELSNEGRIDSETFEAAVISKDIPESPSPLRGWKGIYIFIVTDEVSLDRPAIFRWNTVHGASFIHNLAQTLHKDDCLYLGSYVSRSLYSRIRDHFSNSDVRTALNLKNKNRPILLEHIIVFAFCAKDCYTDSEIRILLPAIENNYTICLLQKPDQVEPDFIITLQKTFIFHFRNYYYLIIYNLTKIFHLKGDIL